MRSLPPQAQPSSISSTFWHWNSPLPYLFLGLGFMILLITTALIILACSFRKRPSRRSDNDDAAAEKAAPPSAAAAVSDNSPKIVVIMAGDDNPSHLAIPMPPAFLSSSDKPCTCNL